MPHSQQHQRQVHSEEVDLKDLSPRECKHNDSNKLYRSQQIQGQDMHSNSAADILTLRLCILQEKTQNLLINAFCSYCASQMNENQVIPTYSGLLRKL